MLDVRDSVGGRQRRQWITRQARGLKARVIRAVLNRVATGEMRHAALLLGYDIAQKLGHEGIFRYLPEFDVGTEIGRTVPVRRQARGTRGRRRGLILELCMCS